MKWFLAVFSRPSASEYPGVRVGGRLAGDPPGTLGPAVLLHAGEVAYNRPGFSRQQRRGGYSGAAVNPSDPSVVWLAGEYARDDG